MRVAHLLFRSSHHHQKAQVAFRAEVVPVVLEVDPCVFAFSVFMDVLLCRFAQGGTHQDDFRKQLPGVFGTQASTCHAWEPQQSTSSLFRFWREVS
jgi:hypothetical protein